MLFSLLPCRASNPCAATLFLGYGSASAAPPCSGCIAHFLQLVWVVHGRALASRSPGCASCSCCGLGGGWRPDLDPEPFWDPDLLSHDAHGLGEQRSLFGWPDALANALNIIE